MVIVYVHAILIDVLVVLLTCFNDFSCIQSQLSTVREINLFSFSLCQKNLYSAWLTTSELRDSVMRKRVKLQLLRQSLKLTSILKEQVSLDPPLMLVLVLVAITCLAFHLSSLLWNVFQFLSITSA